MHVITKILLTTLKKNIEKNVGSWLVQNTNGYSRYPEYP